MYSDASTASTSTGTITRFAGDLQALADQLQGKIVKPGDTEYEAARCVGIASDAMPALIVRCASTPDVVAAVNYGRAHDLDTVVRSGGHSLSGSSIVDGGMVIDLSPMKTIEVNVDAQTARLGAGLTWEEVAEALLPYGLCVTSGDVASVGVGGLCLGGGIGWFARKYGLTIDRIHRIEVVTADGQVVTASETEHPDLFWGMRGGGGNFGIATSFEVAVHPGGMVIGGAIVHDARDTSAVLPAFVRFVEEAPDELTAMAILSAAPPAPFIPPHMHGQPVLVLALIWAGDHEEGLRVLEPLRRLGAPIADIVGPMPYPGIFELTRDATPRNLHTFARSMFVDAFDDALLESMAACAASFLPTGLVQLRILGGAVRRVPAAATAFSHRDAAGLFVVAAYGYAPEQSEQNVAWVQQRYDSVRSLGDGAYVGFISMGEEDRIREVYSPETLARLRALKREWDPTNFFCHNLNITPAAE